MGTSASVLTSRRGEENGRASLVTRLLVCWQHPPSRVYHGVGLLECGADSYTFEYLDSARGIDGFRPFLGFPILDQTYKSGHLFPLFAERVLDAARPDRPILLDALNLTADAGPMEFLARSGGRRGGDTIELLPIPEIVDGETSCVFLVHGVRHQEHADEVISRLRPGDRLRLQPEPDNTHDARAVLVTDDSTRVGWVPSPLLDYVHAVLSQRDHSVTVVRANPPEFGHHLRLLVRLEGIVPAGYMHPWDQVRSRIVA